MMIPILATKLFIPPPRPNVVLRPRLIARLNSGLSGDRPPGVTLISAPVGYGKTTVVSEWVACCQRPTAWLSLDEGDSDSTRFLTYLVAALQTLPEFTGAAASSVLQAPQSLPIEAVLTGLINEISVYPYPFTLVLDDYHLVDSKSVDQALTFLIEHMPAQMRLVMTTREDPQLPLARLRAQGRLTELRASDLRFTAAEAAEFLNQAMGLRLSVEDITALEERTEGWIAGLQLAALTMQGREDVQEFLQSFAGDDRYILDYLVEQVLQRLTTPVRSFLLHTSILDRLNGPLCDAVAGQPGSSAQLAALQRGNFFVIPLDNKRNWYRYHHLFAEVLHLYLVTEQPDQVPVLHRRASEWYEHNGSPTDAIRHALAAGDFERAAGLIELAVPGMSQIRQTGLLFGFLKAIPTETLRARPILCVTYAHLLLDSGEVKGVDDLLQNAERWLNPTAEGGRQPGSQAAAMVVVDEEAFHRLPGAIAVARAGLALARGDVADTEKYARRVLDLLPEDDHINRGGVGGFLGLAAWTSGHLEAAHRAFGEGMAHLQLAGNIPDVIGGAVTLADIRLAQGRLREAMQTYRQALALAKEHGTPALVVRGTADIYVGLSEIYREHDDLDSATQHLRKSKELGEHTGFPQNRYRWQVAMARIREAQGDLDGALALLDEAELLYAKAFSPDVRPIAAMKTRVWIAQGRMREALHWAQLQGLSAADDLSFLRVFDHITLARILLARYRGEHAAPAIPDAIGLLERLREAVQEGGMGGSLMEILVLLALARQAQGDLPAALVPLHQALALAEPEGYVRLFVDEGPPMARLLLEAAASKSLPRQGLADYIDRLLEALQREQTSLPARENANRHAGAERAASYAPMEPLSQRELEILRLFQTELSGPEIAAELTIALSTVRTHTKGIFSKLDVNTRRMAVKRAVELGLL